MDSGNIILSGSGDRWCLYIGFEPGFVGTYQECMDRLHSHVGKPPPPVELPHHRSNAAGRSDLVVDDDANRPG
jgi:hypothetical protein